MLNQSFAKYKGREDDFQKSVASYLDLMDVLWFHAPNGGSRNVIEAKKLKAMGVKSGVPDVLIVESRRGYNGLALELKVGSNKPSLQQMEMLNKLANRNWMTIVTWSLDEAIEIINHYLNED